MQTSSQARALIPPTIGIRWISPIIRILYSQSGARNGQPKASPMRSIYGYAGGAPKFATRTRTHQIRKAIAPAAVLTAPMTQPATAVLRPPRVCGDAAILLTADLPRK